LVTVPTGNYNSDFVQKIINNGVAKPTQVIFYFLAGDSAKPKQLWAYLYPQKESGNVLGKGIIMFPLGLRLFKKSIVTEEKLLS
jgi:hypothetical protein